MAGRPSRAGLNFEQILALRPDLIIGFSSGMTDDEYGTLSTSWKQYAFG